MSETVTREVADIAIGTAKRLGAERERAAVVLWLNMDAAEYVDGGPFGKVVYAALLEAARMIESGSHLSPMEADNGK